MPDGRRADDGLAAGTHPALPVLGDAARSHVPGACPFLRGAEGPLALAASTAVDGQLCIAIGPPRAQSTSQQQLVCLRSAHADCPRYQRGAMVLPERDARSLPRVPRATLAALLILVLSAGISLGYVVQRGGLSMPAAGPSSTDGAVAEAVSPSPDPTDTPLPEPSATVEPSVEVASPASLEPVTTPGATPPPTTETTPSPTPKATPKPKPSATPASDRYKLLVKCPDRAACWVYTVRSGDNLFSIANYFGHSLKTIYAWNPEYPGARLKAGAEIRMPPPTR